MAIRFLREFENKGAAAVTDGVASSSGDNDLVTAASVGAGYALQVLFVKVRNTSSTTTTVKIMTTGDEQIFADVLTANQALVFDKLVQLPEGVGLKLDLSGANTHHWCVCADKFAV